MNYSYVETEKKMEILNIEEGSYTNPANEIWIDNANWFNHEAGTRKVLDAVYKTGIEVEQTFTFSKNVSSKGESFSNYSNHNLFVGKNSSTQYTTIKIYNIWFQLAN